MRTSQFGLECEATIDEARISFREVAEGCHQWLKPMDVCSGSGKFEKVQANFKLTPASPNY